MKIAAVSPDIYSDKEELECLRLKRIRDAEEVEEVIHFYRGPAEEYKEEKIRHKKISEREKSDNYLIELYDFTWNLFHRLREDDIDAVYSFDLQRLPMIYTVSQTTSAQIVSQIGIDINYYTNYTTVWKKLLNPVLNRCNKVIFLAEHLSDNHDLKTDTEVVYPLISLEPFLNQELSKRGNSDNIGMLYVGRLSKPKGIKKVLNIFPSLKQDIDNLELTIIGDNTKNEDEYTRRVKKKMESLEHKYPESFKWEGWIKHSKLPKRYSEASLTILPSNTEGFNAVLAESLASGTYVIGSNIPFYREILRDKSYGSIAKAGELRKEIMETIENSKFETTVEVRKDIKKLIEKSEKSWKKIFEDLNGP